MIRKIKYKKEFVVQFMVKVKYCVLINEFVIVREENNDKIGVIRYIYCIFLFFIVCFYFFIMCLIIMQIFFFFIFVIVVCLSIKYVLKMIKGEKVLLIKMLVYCILIYMC